MMFCTKCGAEMAEGAAFCTACGSTIEADAGAPQGEYIQAQPQQGNQQQYQAPPQQQYQAPPQQQQYQAPPQQQQYQAPPQQQYQQPYQQSVAYENYPEYETDSFNNKVAGIVAYLGLVVIVSILAAPKDSKFARFHSNQGLVLLIIELGGSIVIGILSSIFMLAGAWWIAPLLGFLFSVCTLILAILGIMNAANRRMKELPVIGKIKILK